MNGKGGMYIKKLLEEEYFSNDFSIELIEFGPLKDMQLLEKKYSKNNLFPIGLNGNTGQCVVWTEDHRKKMKKINKEVQNRPEIKEKNIASKLGKKYSDKIKLNMSLAKIGNKNPMYGKIHSDETKKKMSKPKSEEHKIKISVSNKGNPKTKDHCKKLSEFCKGKTTVFNKLTHETSKITLEEFNLNKNIYLSVHSIEYRQIKSSINNL